MSLPPTLRHLTRSLLLLLTCAWTTLSITLCPPCGNTTVPYPFSTSPTCGDQSYKLRCDPTTSSLLFDTLNNSYPIASISPLSQRLVVRPSSFLSSSSCVTSDITHNGLQLNQSLPFNVTSSSTIFLLNCSVSILHSPLDCSSSSLCHTYVNNTNAAVGSCLRAPICCTFRTGRATSYMIRVWDSGCSAYTSFVNLDPVLPMTRWPEPGVEIQWVAPREPVCGGQADCDGKSVCGSDPVQNGVKRCFCNSGFRWDPVSGFCVDVLVQRTGQDLNQKKKKGQDRTGLLAGAVAGFVALVAISGCYFWEKKRKDRLNVEAFLRNYGPLQVKRYSYSDVKKMTNSFKKKLGQGGYGGVYKGELKDGRLVAVKVLNRSKGDGEEFMNEVATISRTSHVNIVSLLGFCFECSKRALIYEYMPNGSLEKFIFDVNNPQKDLHLGWKALDRISLGIARGLEYLHRGCNTRILHFDIKPHNILLDDNFSPKISDFGLAKICDRNESIVSMLCARGTAGYIAPEVFCRSFGGVSHKSDVYSYGMMLSEMVGGRRNINVDVEETSEIYFPHWIYKRLELDEDLGLQCITNEEDKTRARKMIIVSLWCIQTDPSNRPAMKEVIEMLEGSVESLQIPPKPYLSSPPKFPTVGNSSTTFVST